MDVCEGSSPCFGVNISQRGYIMAVIAGLSRKPLIPGGRTTMWLNGSLNPWCKGTREGTPMSFCILSICLSSKSRLTVHSQQGKLRKKVASHFPDLLAYLQPARSWIHSGYLINSVTRRKK